jgi:hypothetical protein
MESVYIKKGLHFPSHHGQTSSNNYLIHRSLTVCNGGVLLRYTTSLVIKKYTTFHKLALIPSSGKNQNFENYATH